MSLMWMFRCEEVSRKISEAMDRCLPWHQRMGIRFHLAMCKYCSRFEEHLYLIRDFCRFEPGDAGASGDSAGLSEDAKDRLKQTLRQ